MSSTEVFRVTASPARRVQTWVTANMRELVFAIGLALVTSGLALVSVPAALIAPGVLLVWLAIPPRGPKV